MFIVFRHQGDQRARHLQEDAAAQPVCQREGWAQPMARPQLDRKEIGAAVIGTSFSDWPRGYGAARPGTAGKPTCTLRLAFPQKKTADGGLVRMSWPSTNGAATSDSLPQCKCR